MKSINQSNRPAAKWACLINDTLYPMPRQKLTARDILDQCGAPSAAILLRDRGTPDDGGFEQNELVDLSEGNVFNIATGLCALDRDKRKHPAKLAFVCDDAWEVTLVARQTGHSLKRLLDIVGASELYRDFESPDDVLIQDPEEILFAEGCVFRTRKHGSPNPDIMIIVNTREHRVRERVITYEYVVSLAFPNPDYNNKVYTVKYTDGVPPNSEGSLSPGDKVRVKNGTIFSVSATDKS